MSEWLWSIRDSSFGIIVLWFWVLEGIDYVVQQLPGCEGSMYWNSMDIYIFMTYDVVTHGTQNLRNEM